MTDNVIILGAGASYDAGIPLMDGFIEKIRLLNSKGKIGNQPLSPEDKTIFSKAIAIMNDLDNYHARAAFNDRNLEDVLSILAFNILGGKSYTRIKLDNMINAIARTIELTCNVKHNGRLNEVQTNGNEIYRNFWESLFCKFTYGDTFPTIITLNYDLVLERSLLQALISTNYEDDHYDGVILKYYYPGVKDYAYKIRRAYYSSNATESAFETDISGSALDFSDRNKLKRPLNIEILKLHGSLNFPKHQSIQTTNNIVEVLNSPFIIPPVSNKSLSGDLEKTWGEALKQISQCKNLYIVGYSLPKTDVYFQFFLKAALGPNHDFNKMQIFNPSLFESDKDPEIKQRYENCFPSEFRNQINFHPQATIFLGRKGSFEHFVSEISSNDNFFY